MYNHILFDDISTETISQLIVLDLLLFSVLFASNGDLNIWILKCWSEILCSLKVSKFMMHIFHYSLFFHRLNN